MKVDRSGLEVMLALHTRCAGHVRKQVKEEMQRDTPAPLQSESHAPKLACLQQVLDYAYGAHGDKISLDNHIGKPDVEKFNKEAEGMDYYSTNQAYLQTQKQTSQAGMKMK